MTNKTVRYMYPQKSMENIFAVEKEGTINFIIEN
jgi:hypothetical protein